MRNQYHLYKVLWTIYHIKGNGPHYCILSSVIKARNISECLKKSELIKKYDIMDHFFADYYIIKPSTIYLIDNNKFYTYVEGFWRESWGIYFSKEYQL